VGKLEILQTFFPDEPKLHLTDGATTSTMMAIWNHKRFQWRFWSLNFSVLTWEP